MRISDWSSDVCSSDLRHRPRRPERNRIGRNPRGRRAIAPRKLPKPKAALPRFHIPQRAIERVARRTRRHQQLHRGARFGGIHFRDMRRGEQYLVAASGRILAKIIDGSAFRSEEHTSELQSLMRISYAVFCLKKKNNTKINKQV